LILVDSSVWIDYFRGNITTQSAMLDSLLGVEDLAIGDLILAEVLQGFNNDSEFKLARRLLTSLPMLEICGPLVALQAAHNSRQLRRMGVTVRKTIDALIAARCVVSGLSLLHSDKDFDPFAQHLGLRVVV